MPAGGNYTIELSLCTEDYGGCERCLAAKPGQVLFGSDPSGDFEYGAVMVCESCLFELIANFKARAAACNVLKAEEHAL